MLNKKKVVLSALVVLALASLVHAGMAYRTVAAGDTDVVQFFARAGEPMLVAIEGDTDTDLDLFILTNNFVAIASNLNYTDCEEVYFVAPYTGTYYASVENLGRVYNEYVIWVE